MPVHEKGTFQYLEWKDLFYHEKPFQIIIDLPQDALASRKSNLTFHQGGEELIEDVRDRLDEFDINKHGFFYVTSSSQLSGSDFEDKKKIEEIYLPECEQLVRNAIEGVDRVYCYNWLVSNEDCIPISNRLTVVYERFETLE